jgi:anti-anti-sigma factor
MNPVYHIENKEHGILLFKIYNLLGEYANREILQVADMKIAEGFSNFVVDLKEVDFMNSVGLNCLISLWKKIEAQKGQMIVANSSAKVRQLLKMTKLNDLFVQAPSTEAGMNALLKKV